MGISKGGRSRSSLGSFIGAVGTISVEPHVISTVSEPGSPRRGISQSGLPVGIAPPWVAAVGIARVVANRVGD